MSTAKSTNSSKRAPSDVRVLRLALAQAGFEHTASWATIYNNKAQGSRCLKIVTRRIEEAPKRSRVKLERVLRKTFGKRFLSAYCSSSSSFRGDYSTYCVDLLLN